MKIEIWSDILCPFCHIGKRRLEAALAKFPHREHVEVGWRAFELDPSAERGEPGSLYEKLARKYHQSEADARRMCGDMTEMAAGEGLTFDFARATPANSFDAHRLAKLAAEVRADEDEAARLGVRAVPFFVLDRKLAVSGAQPVELFESALERAWKERPAFETVGRNGAVCDERGCRLE